VWGGLYQLERGQWLRALVGVLLLPLVIGYGVVSALGFWSESRGVVVDGRSNARSSLSDAEAELATAEARRASLGSPRPGRVIEVDIEALQRERLWDRTRQCRDAAAGAARIFCKRYDALRAELGLRAESEALDLRMTALKVEIREARASGAWREADPLAATLAGTFGFSLPRVRRDLAWWAALLVEAVSCLGLLVVDKAGMRSMAAPGKRSTDGPAPWRLVGRAAEGEAGAAEAKGATRWAR
jgi:hypothetical protein